MAIKFGCGHCGKRLGVGDHLAGRKGKCPDCGTIFTVPKPSTPSPPPPPARGAKQAATDYSIKLDDGPSAAPPGSRPVSPCRRRRFIIAATAVGILALGVVLWLSLRGRKEPVYRGQPIGYWIAQMSDKDDGARGAAIAAVAEMGRDAAPWLREHLGDDDRNVREGAAEALGIMGEADRIPIEFENTPEGAAKRLYFALLWRDEGMLRDGSKGLNDATVAKLMAIHIAAPFDAEPNPRVTGNQAYVKVGWLGDLGKMGDYVIESQVDGVWKADFSILATLVSGEELMKRMGAGEEREQACLKNLTILGGRIWKFQAAGGSFPGPGLKLLTMLYTHPDRKGSVMAEEGEEGLDWLTCPEAGGGRPTYDRVAAADPGCTSYECVEGQIRMTEQGTEMDAPIAWDKAPVHGGKRNVLLLNGSVRLMPEEEFQKLRATTEAWNAVGEIIEYARQHSGDYEGVLRMYERARPKLAAFPEAEDVLAEVIATCRTLKAEAEGANK